MNFKGNFVHCTKIFLAVLGLSWLQNAPGAGKDPTARGRSFPSATRALLEIAKRQMIVYASRAPSWSQLDPSVPTFSEMPEGMKRPGA